MATNGDGMLSPGYGKQHIASLIGITKKSGHNFAILHDVRHIDENRFLTNGIGELFPFFFTEPRHRRFIINVFISPLAPPIGCHVTHRGDVNALSCDDLTIPNSKHAKYFYTRLSLDGNKTKRHNDAGLCRITG